MDWAITWRLVAEGAGTGFDLDDPRHRKAFTNMSRGWAGTVLPRLARESEDVAAS